MKRKLFVTPAEYRQIMIWLSEFRAVQAHEKDDARADAFGMRTAENIADLCGMSLTDLRGAPLGQQERETYLAVITDATEIPPEGRIEENEP